MCLLIFYLLIHSFIKKKKQKLVPHPQNQTFNKNGNIACLACMVIPGHSNGNMWKKISKEITKLINFVFYVEEQNCVLFPSEVE